MTRAEPDPQTADCLVWWATSEPHPGLRHLLDDADRQRARQLRTAPDRNRFVTARALLRLVLADRLDRPAPALQFTHRCRRCGSSRHGKPELLTPGPAFSITHVAGLAGVALGTGPLGIDAEPAHDPLDPERTALAPVALHPAERAIHEGADPAARGPAVIRWWTRKEAVLKATGWGLAVSPQLLRISAPDEAPVLLEGPADWTETSGSARIHLVDLRPPSGYVACLARVGTTPPRVREFDGDSLLRRALATG